MLFDFFTLKRHSKSRNVAERLIAFIPGFSIITLVMGYLSFNTYTYINFLPFIIPSTSTVVGLGIMHISFLVIMFLATPPKKYWIVPMGLALGVMLNIFLFDLPVLLILVLPLGMVNISQYFRSYGIDRYIEEKENYRMEIRKKMKYRKKRTLVRFLVRIRKMFYVFLLTIFFVIAYFDYRIALSIIVCIITLITIREIKYKGRFDYRFIIMIFIIPIIFTATRTDSSLYSIVGLGKQNIIIVTDKDTIFAELVYKDENIFYTIHPERPLVVQVIDGNNIKGWGILKGNGFEGNGLWKLHNVMSRAVYYRRFKEFETFMHINVYD